LQLHTAELRADCDESEVFPARLTEQAGMSRQSNAFKRLVALYDGVVRHMREIAFVFRAIAAVPWARVERLEPRVLLSASPSEFALNQTLNDNQQLPAIASDGSGNFIAVWQSHNQDGNGWGVYGRQYNASGTALGNEFLINQTTQGDQTNPAVACDAAGAFVVTWISNNEVYARLFNANGTAATNEFVAVAVQPSGTSTPSVAMDGNGNFAVVSDESIDNNSAILLQRFTASGIASGSLLSVNTSSSKSQFNPSIAMNAAGNAVVAWTNDQTGHTKIDARQFNSNATAVGDDFQVGASGNDNQDFAKAGLDSSGNFAVTWQDNFGGAGAIDVMARRYNVAGTALDAAPVTVNTYTTSNQQSPSIAELPAGQYFIAWQSNNEDGNNWGVYGQMFNADGSRNGSETQINTTTQGPQQDPAVTWNGTTATVVWDGQGAVSNQAIYGQQFVTPSVANQAPVITSPYSQTIAQGGTLTFSSAGGTQITDLDSDGGTGTEQISLSVGDGTLTLASTSGLTFLTGTGTSDTVVTIDGTLADLNAALNGLVYTPQPGFSGSDTLQMTANDLGNSGTGGPQSVTAGVAMTMTPVAYTPSVTNATVSLLSQSNSGLVITPNALDNFSGYFRITSISGGTLYQNNGSTSISNGQFITFAQGEAGLTFSPGLLSTGGSFNVQASTSNSSAGLGGSVVGATVTVGGAPINNVPGSQTTKLETPLVFSSTNGNAITISDTATPTITLSVDSGTLSLSPNLGVSISQGSGSNDTQVQFSGTVDQVNAALNGLTFTPPSNFTGTATITLVNVSGGLLGSSTTSPISVAVTPAGRTPTLTNATTRENVQTVSGLVITQNPLDSGSDYFKITSITGGTLFQGDGVTQINNGNYIASAQGAAGLRFTANPDSTSAGGFSVQASASNSDSGLGGSVVTASIAVYGPLVVTLNSSTLAYTEGQGSSAIDSSMVVTDPGSAPLTGATVQLTGYVPGEDVLSFTPQSGITGSFDTSAGVLTLSGNASAASYQAALQSVTYADSSQNPSVAPRVAVVTVSDSISSSIGAMRSIQVTSLNNAPAISAPVSATTGENTADVFSGAGLVSVADVDSGGASEIVTLTATHGTITLGSTAGLSAVSGNSSASVTLTGTIAALNSALSGMSFVPATGYFGAASITIGINDQGNTGTGGALAAASTVPITVNEAPPVAVNDSYTAYQAQALIVPTYTGVLANDSDINGFSLSPILISGPANGSIAWVPSGLTGLTTLTTGSSTSYQAAWSPDGSKLAFSSDRSGNYEIYVMNADGSGLVQLTNQGATNIQAAWSPDGTKIAFYSDRTGNPEIWVMNANGSSQTQLTNNGDVNGQPTWSPDGTKIAYTSNVPGNYELYVMNANGSGQTRITNLSGTNNEPKWSPDGNTIAFVSNGTGAMQIYEVSPQGTGLTRITNDAYNDSRPTWNPTSSQLIFISARGTGNTELYVMNADGSSQSLLMSTTATDDFPAWSHDGSKITFESDGQVAVANLQFSGGFTYVSNSTFVGTDTFTYQAFDGTLTSNTATVSINVLGPLTVSMNGTPLAYTESQGATVLDSSVTLADPRSSTLTGATIAFTAGFAPGEDALSFTSQSGITGAWNSGTGQLTLTGNASVAAYQTALRSITYTDSSQNPSTTVRTVTITLTDTTSSTGSGNRSIQVTSINNAPTVIAPASLSTPEDTAIAFSGTNAITVSDVDAGSGIELVSLSAVNGTLMLGSTAGLASVSGDGTASVAITGTLTALNNALNGMQFIPASHAFGTGSIGLSINDQGNTGTGGALTATAGAAITINRVAHTPSVTNASTLENQQTTSGLVISPDPLDSSMAGDYRITSITGGTLSLADGTTLANGSFITFAEGSDGLKFMPSTNSLASGSFTVQASTSSSPTGLGGSAVTATIEVIGVPAISGSGLAYTEKQGPVPIIPTITVTDSGSSTLIGASVQIVGYQAGEDVLASTPVNGIAESFDATTGVLTLTGTAPVAEYQTALQSVTYENTSDNPHTGARSAVFIASDQHSSASGSYPIDVTAVDDAPTLAVPIGQTLDEDTVLTLASSNAISVGDVDGGTGLETMTLSASHGSLSLATTSGLSAVSGNGTGSVSFSGTISQLNSALDGLQYAPGLHFVGGDTITVTINDNGNTGIGGPLSATAPIGLTINAVAHTPSVTGATTRTNHSTSNGLVITPSAIDANLAGFYQITGITGGNLFLSDGMMPVAEGDFITFAQGNQGLQFAPTTDFSGAASFSVQASTSSLGSSLGGSTVSAQIDVLALPTISLNAAPLAYTEKQGPVAIDPALVLTDAGSATLTGATVVLAGFQSGQDALGFVDQNGITGNWDTATATLTLSGTADVATYQSALQSVTYTDASADPATSPRQADFTLLDPTASSYTVGRSIEVAAVNDAPTITLPSAQAILEDNTLVFSTSHLNAIALADVDAEGGIEALTLTASNGTLTVVNAIGLASLGGNASSAVSLTGTIAQLNAALEGLQFVPASHYFGNAGLSIAIDDQGNAGVGGPMSASGSVAISVARVAHTPAVTNAATNENAPSLGLVITPDPLDSGLGGYDLITGITEGSLYQADGVTPVQNGRYIPFADGAAGLVFVPQTDSTATGSFAVRASVSPDASGLGGLVATASIAVLPVPQVLVPGPQMTLEDTSIRFSAADGNSLVVSDPGAPSGRVEVTLSASAGLISLEHHAGLTFTTGTDTDSQTMDFTGTFDAVQQALDGLKFAPTLHAFGAATIDVTATEGANSAAGEIPIYIQWVAHTPTVLGASTHGSQQTTSGLILSPNYLDSSAQGYFQITGIVGGTLYLNDGATPVNDGDFISFAQGASGLRFTPASNAVATGHFWVQESTLPDISGLGGAPVPVTIRNAAGSQSQSLASLDASGSEAAAGGEQSDSDGAPSGGAQAVDQQGQSSADSAADDQQSDGAAQHGQKDQSSRQAAGGVAPSSPSRPDAGGLRGSSAASKASADLLSNSPMAINQRATTSAATRSDADLTVGRVMHSGKLVVAHRLSTGLRTLGTLDVATGLSFLSNRGSAMWHELDTVHKRLVSDAPMRVWAGSASVVSMGVSVVYFLWMVRAGSLLSSLLSSMPAWRLVDPLPILDHLSATASVLRRGEDDGLDQIIRDAAGR
jgi:Tol biopolymer transport system component